MVAASTGLVVCAGIAPCRCLRIGGSYDLSSRQFRVPENVCTGMGRLKEGLLDGPRQGREGGDGASHGVAWASGSASASGRFTKVPERFGDGMLPGYSANTQSTEGPRTRARSTRAAWAVM